MRRIDRRTFLKTGALPLAAQPRGGRDGLPIDFRYAPLAWQTAFCFPDDPYKSLAGERGDLRYGFERGRGFAHIVEFSARGMEPDTVGDQHLEAPGVPIVHTRIDRPEAFLELTAFATNRPGEGRVDNVVLAVRPRTRHAIHAAPLLRVSTRHALAVRNEEDIGRVHLDSESGPLFLAASVPLRASEMAGGYELSMPERRARPVEPLHCFFRFPQQGQSFEQIRDGLNRPAELLAEVRAWWRNWRPFAGGADWKLPGAYNDFLVACARNILQAREVRDGKLTFQVGPTVYRGLWVVDGHFLLEAARYLGYDGEAQQGLETTWARQRDDGGIFAGAGGAHWKDTAIAMFTMVRQAELSRDWSYFRRMKPNLLRAVDFLVSLREKARAEGGANGRYGLLARGTGDGGLGGIRPELTNTVWVLAGLKATVEAADHLGLTGFERVKQFYGELRESFLAAARQEMRRHPKGFDYLPMLMKEDAQWSAPDEWDRPQPQVAQWALSHAIYPGLVFEKDDPIVQGHLALMQACAQEEIPAETGWLPHEGVWTYNAAFAAHAYLWAGLPDWARSTFHGFLNHATPLYCWREEQPLRGSLVARYIGDMPHNWAGAECILYLRHMLALEDGRILRLLPGLGDIDLLPGQPYQLAASPSRFGRLDLELEPDDRGRAWRLAFRRAEGPVPASVVVPRGLGSRLSLTGVSGASYRRAGDAIEVDPAAAAWSATWRG